MPSIPTWQRRAQLPCTADSSAPTAWWRQASHRWGRAAASSTQLFSRITRRTASPCSHPQSFPRPSESSVSDRLRSAIWGRLKGTEAGERGPIAPSAATHAPPPTSHLQHAPGRFNRSVTKHKLLFLVLPEGNIFTGVSAEFSVSSSDQRSS